MTERSKAARQFLADAQRLEAKARCAPGARADELARQAHALRQAAARIAERDAVERGELPLFG